MKKILISALLIAGSIAGCNDNLSPEAKKLSENPKTVKFENNDAAAGIVPRPAKFTVFNKPGFEISANTKIVYTDKNLKRVADYLTQTLAKSTGLSLKASLAPKAAPGENTIFISVLNTGKNWKKSQSYILDSTKKGVVIVGSDPAGAFYGAVSMLQLMPAEVFASKKQNQKWVVKSALISDQPSFEKIRGLHVDVSRHFRTKKEMFEIIDHMAMHKLNTMQIHLTDDQGWRVEIKAYPKLTEIGSRGNRTLLDVRRKKYPAGPAKFYTQKDLKEIADYARSRFIDIIPEIDMPGHMRAVIAAYPEMKAPTDRRRIPKVIRIDEKGVKFCKTVLKEVNDLLKPKYIHIGCDEVNLGSRPGVYTDKQITKFAATMSEYILNELKATPIAWDDALMKGLNNKSTVTHWWRYGKVHWWRHLPMTADQKIQKFNHPYIMSPAVYTYFDMKQLPREPGGGWARPLSVAECYNWDPFLDLRNYDPKKRHLALGAVACTWSEMMPTYNLFQERVFPRLAAHAENCWAPLKANGGNPLSWEKYRDTVLVPYQIKRYDAMGINYWSKKNPAKLKTLRSKKKKNG